MWQRFLASAIPLIAAIGGIAMQPEPQQDVWQQDSFVIGLYYDPPLSHNRNISARAYVERDSLSMLMAKEAGFNLLTGIQQLHANLSGGLPDSTIRYYPFHIARSLGLNYLIRLSSTEVRGNTDFTPFTATRYDGLYGFNVKDEPTNDDIASIRRTCNAIKALEAEAQPHKKLAFVNLLPIYAMKSDSAYKNYLRAYADDSMALSVLCFDHYEQHTSPASYFYNLSLMRKAAGKRPLWSYVRSCEETTDMDSLTQEAYLRMGVFAPLAYGAKGILYYSYDRPEPDYVLIDYNHAKPGWEAERMYLNMPVNDYDVFTGYFDASHPDSLCVAVKSDDNGGTWRIKYNPLTRTGGITDTTVQWSRVRSKYGTKDHATPIVGDWNGDGKDDLMTFTRRDTMLLVDMNMSGWNARISFRFLNEKVGPIGVNTVAAGMLDAGSLPDLFLAWNDENGGDSVRIRIVVDYGTKGDGTCRKIVKHAFPGKLAQVIRTDTCRSACSLYALTIQNGNAVLHQWRNSLTAEPQKLSVTLPAGLTPASILHYSVEPDTCGALRLLAQTKGGTILYGEGKGDKVVLDSTLAAHSSPYIYPLSVRSRRVKNEVVYDLYGIGAKEEQRDALMDKEQRPTRLFGIAKNINHYIRRNMAQVVMNCAWKGAWHSASSFAKYSLPASIGNETPLLKTLGDSLLAGVFEQSDTCFFIIVVNTGFLPAPKSLWLKGNLEGRVTMHARIDNSPAKTELGTFSVETFTTKVDLDTIQSGEGVLLEVRRRIPYSVRHRKARYEATDSIDDIYMRHNGTWYIDYSSNGFGTWDKTVSGCGTDASSTPAPGDYDGDSLTDISYLDYAGTWHLRYNKTDISESFALPTDNESVFVPFVGNYNGDSIYDLCYRSNAGTMRLIYNKEKKPLPYEKLALYGDTMWTCPASGDYDGDGLDDLALYRRDDTLLIDFAHNKLYHWELRQPAVVGQSNRWNVKPVPDDYDGDGVCDFALWNDHTGKWLIDLAYNEFGAWDVEETLACPAGAMPQSGDYDGDGLADFCLCTTNKRYLYYSRHRFKQAEVLPASSL